MRLSIFPRALLRQRQLYNPSRRYPSQAFHASARLDVLKPFLLADIGEGIRECEIIQWFVEPEARVEEFDKICEVQSDKASVEITTRFTGVIKKLYYESGEMAIVGKPLVDIDVQEEAPEEEVLESPTTTPSAGAQEAKIILETSNATAQKEATSKLNRDLGNADEQMGGKGTHAALATPAIRHLTKELDVNIAEVAGTGRNGRVLKEDVYKFADARNTGSAAAASESSPPQSVIPSSNLDEGRQKETIVQLSTVQGQMFKTMTRSLTIPHFLYADEIDFSNLSNLRHRLNKTLLNPSAPVESTKLSFLPFIIKAVSLALHQYPILNARVELKDTSKPALAMRSQHNIGIAMATPSGLLVPVIKSASTLSVPQIANEISRLQALATSNKLSSADLTGGTITISNIGNIGGTYVSPVIVDSQVAILGIGKVRTVPRFATATATAAGAAGGVSEGTAAAAAAAAAAVVVPAQICNFSWSADHRVVDGATMARAAEVVRGFIEEPDSMLVHLR